MKQSLPESNMGSGKPEKGQFNRIVPFLFLTILSLHALHACQKSDKNQEEFGVGLIYHLDPNEKAFIPVKTAGESFAYISKVGEISLLMNKAFVTPESKTYISFLSNNKIEAFLKAHFQDSTLLVIDSNSNKGSYSLLFSKKPFLVFRHLLPENKHHLKMVLDVMSTDSSHIDNIYRHRDSFISKKISDHEN